MWLNEIKSPSLKSSLIVVIHSEGVKIHPLTADLYIN